MQHWDRKMYFEDTQLSLFLPSPNQGRAESTLNFLAIVLVEGNTLSEGRGTAQALEITGLPKIETFSFYKAVLFGNLNK